MKRYDEKGYQSNYYVSIFCLCYEIISEVWGHANMNVESHPCPLQSTIAFLYDCVNKGRSAVTHFCCSLSNT